MDRSKGLTERLLLDRANECVHQGVRQLRLTPKAFAVARFLLERPGRLVTKDELLAAVWPDTMVTDASLSTCIREIRRTLDDDPAAPRYIQTVHRRGYRFVGALADGPSPGEPTRPHGSAAGPLVGRERELAWLAGSLRRVEAGERRLVFLGGEAGIGKTTLVEHFVSDTARRRTAQIARGQCVEPYGACEAYLPWFDALNHLARDSGRERLAALLRRYAPMWLAQLPWLVDASERARLHHEIAGATRERMIRELAEALEALSVERPVVVVLEDLHWSDPSSLDLLGYLARRQRPGRLLLLGTYRFAELHAASHPLMSLKQELRLHGACDDLSLDFLSREAVGEYVRTRLPGVPDELATHVHRRTDGNPLFVVNVIDYLLARGALAHDDGQWRLTETGHAAQTDVPENLKAMIERQLDRLSDDDRRVLEAASVVGAMFSAASVAAALEEPVESSEERLGALARRQSFVRGTDRHSWPDGTESDGYTFVHVLYQNVLYERIGGTRRSRMHRQVGVRLEAGHRARAAEIAAELALHFQRGQEARRAVCYLAQAGENAIRRSAFVEAITLLKQGLALLPALPEGADRDASELQLQVPLGVSYINTRGYAAPEVGVTFQRAHGLCRENDPARLFRVLRGLWLFEEQRAHLTKARAVAEQILRLAKRERHPVGLVEAHRIMGAMWFHLGNFPRALTHLRQGLALYDMRQHSAHALPYGQDPGVGCLAWISWIHWYLGDPDQAVSSAARGVELARQLAHPFSLGYALNFAGRLHLCKHEPEHVRAYARDAIECAREHGLTSLLAMAQILHGWSRAVQDDVDAGIRELEDGIARWRSTGALLMVPYWLHLQASALDHAGRPDQAVEVLDAAFAEAARSEERWFECEMYILKASLAARGYTSQHRRRSHIRGDLHRALHAATELRSPFLRLRAAHALSSLGA